MPMSSPRHGCDRFCKHYGHRRRSPRRPGRLLAVSAAAILFAAAAPGATFHVWTNSPHPAAPFNDWTNAARTIQAAVDAAAAGDTVVVTDGVYSVGVRATPGYSLSNRVVITNAILVRSVNGPDVTSIVGAPASGGGLGPDAVRCVYISAGTLSGFTLTNGFTRDTGHATNDCSGGGVSALGAVVTNCLITGNRAYWYGGGAWAGTLRDSRIAGNVVVYRGGGSYDAVLRNCDVVSNVSSNSGGGACFGMLTNCVIEANRASMCGGGAFGAALADCVVRSNFAYTGGGAGEGHIENCLVATNVAHYGGGVYGATVVGCVITGNASYGEGGGASYGVLERCTIVNNVSYNGGGAFRGYLTNCVFIGNRGNGSGGGAYACTMVHCTLVTNWAWSGGGAYGSDSRNCILYYNAHNGEPNNVVGGSNAYCCVAPLMPGDGNITNEPLFADRWSGDLRLAEGSPCVDAAADLGVIVDRDGSPRPLDGDNDDNALPDMGAYERPGFIADSDTLLYLPFDHHFSGTQGESPVVAPPVGVALAEGVCSNAARFPSGTYLTYSATGNFDSRSGSLEFWIRPNWYGTNGLGQLFLDFPNATNGVGFLKDGGTALRTIFWENGPGGHVETDIGYGIGNWQSNEWHHVAFTWDTNALRMYVDARLLRERLPPYYLPSITGPRLYVGGSAGMYSDGAMDEVRVSGRPRAASEILAHVVASVSNRSFTAVEILAVTSPVTLYETWTTVEDVSLKGYSSAGVVHLPPEAGAWTSANPNIATVDPHGRITAVSSGETTVAVSAGGATTALVVRVRAPLIAPTNEAIPALLGTPASACVYEVPVVIIQYLPTTNGTTLDAAEAGVGWSLATARSEIQKQAIQSKFMLEEGSRFQGYKAIRAAQPEPRPSIGYRVVDYITVYEPLPSGVLAGGAAYYPHYGQILERFGGERYVNEQGVREFWVWGYHYGRIVPVEWYIATPAQPDIADYFDSIHSVIKPIMPVYGKTYTLYNYNFTRSLNECVHDHGHQLEGVMSYFAMRQDDSQDFFWKLFVGPTVVGSTTNRRCGWTHMPPNTDAHYDYANATWASSDIEDWRSAGGTGGLVNYTTWRDVNYPWPSGYAPWSSQRSEAHWYIYWMQNMPGFSNAVAHTNDQVMTDWWAFTGNWDDSLEAGMGLHVTPVDLSLSWSGPTNVGEEEVFAYELHLTNSGPRAGTNLSVRHPLPPALHAISATGSIGTCGIGDGVVTCRLESLAVGGMAVVTVRVQAVRAGLATNTAIASAPWQETDARNNRATWAVAVSDDNDGDGLPNAWERLHFGDMTQAVASADSDDDGADNWQEYVAGTQPTNAESAFRVLGASHPADEAGYHYITVATEPDRKHTIYFTDEGLSNGVPWSPFSDPGRGVWVESRPHSTNYTFVDDEGPETTGGPPPSHRYYRVRVERP